MNAAPDLIAKAEAYDRVERLCVGTSRRVLPYQIRRALAIPAEGGEHVHLLESDGCITVGCPTQVCAACGHVENPHIEGCKAAQKGAAS